MQVETALQGASFEVAAVSRWLKSAARTMKGLRLYDENNQQLQSFLAGCYHELSNALAQIPDLTLVVREDRLLFHNEPAFVDPDRDQGIPFAFYSNGFRRLTFDRAFESWELVSLLKALDAHAQGTQALGEDLYTAIWRLNLPHFRYMSIDALSMAVDKDDRQSEEDAKLEVDRLHDEIDALLSRIYDNQGTEVADEDLVKGVSLSEEDLVALEQIQKLDEDELSALDVVTARAVTGISGAALAALATEVATDDLPILLDKHVSLLALLNLSGSAESLKAPVQLIDKLILSRQLDRATYLLTELLARAPSVPLGDYLATEERVALLIELADQDIGHSTHQIALFLRALGPNAVPHILTHLGRITGRKPRQLVCQVLLEHRPTMDQLRVAMLQAEHWYVVEDLLGLLIGVPAESAEPILLELLGHAHPRVRARAVTLLAAMPPGGADDAVAAGISDSAPEVRVAAAKAASFRRSQSVLDALEKQLQSKHTRDAPAAEIQSLMTSYVAIAGPNAIALLEALLCQGLFGKASAVDIQLAAIHALRRLGSPEAKDAVKRGGRTLNKKIRDACKLALDHWSEGGMRDSDPSALGPAVPSLGLRSSAPPAMRTTPPIPAPIGRVIQGQASSAPPPAPVRVVQGQPSSAPPAGRAEQPVMSIPVVQGTPIAKKDG